MSNQKFEKRIAKIADLEMQIAALKFAREEILTLRSENRALKAQKKSLEVKSSSGGLVSKEPVAKTVVATTAVPISSASSHTG